MALAPDRGISQAIARHWGRSCQIGCDHEGRLGCRTGPGGRGRAWGGGRGGRRRGLRGRGRRRLGHGGRGRRRLGHGLCLRLRAWCRLSHAGSCRRRLAIVAAALGGAQVERGRADDADHQQGHHYRERTPMPERRPAARRERVGPERRGTVLEARDHGSVCPAGRRGQLQPSRDGWPSQRAPLDPRTAILADRADGRICRSAVPTLDGGTGSVFRARHTPGPTLRRREVSAGGTDAA